MQSIEAEIRSFIVDHFLLGDGSSLKNDDSFLENGTFDSTGVLELVSFLEKRFSVQINAEELVPENLDSVNALKAFLERKLSQREAVVAAHTR